jgi:Flp pilus assembly pilin Flp
MKPKAQSIIEYSILIAVVAAAFIAMHTYVQRALQTNLKRIDSQLSPLPKE